MAATCMVQELIVSV